MLEQPGLPGGGQPLLQQRRQRRRDGDLQHIPRQEGQHTGPEDGGEIHGLAHVLIQYHRHVGQSHGVQHRQPRKARQRRPNGVRRTVGGEQADDPRSGDQSDEKAAGGLSR